jgi:tetratricopeptide (TPR) repeat protein
VAEPAPSDFQRQATEWVTAHFGTTGLVVIFLLSTACACWWNWDKIQKLPGVAWFLARLFPHKDAPPTPLPRPKEGRLAVAVVHLDGDLNSEMERLVTEALSEVEDLQVLRFDRVIASTGGNVEDAIQAGHNQARGLLVESGADILVWGTVLRNGPVAIPKLHWTASRDLPVESRSRRYMLSEQLEFPDIFRSDLTEILDLLVLAIGVYFSPQKPRTRGPLPEFIKRVHKLLTSEGAQWPPATRRNLTFALADLCLVHGIQDWKNDEWLRMARDAYENAIPKDDTVWYSHTYLTAFYNLAQVHLYRGTCLNNREFTISASELYRRIAGITAATDYPEDRWLYVASHTQLGNILRVMGDEDDDPVKLSEALAAYREVADTHDPYFRHQILFGLAEVLRLIGEHETDTVHLKQAVASYEAVIRETTDEESRKILLDKLLDVHKEISLRSSGET